MAKPAQQPINATPKPAAAATPNILPRPDFHFPGEIGRTYLDSDPAQFPKPVQAPEGAPNILLILIDDCGFGQYGTFGGGIPCPTMDRLAAEASEFIEHHRKQGALTTSISSDVPHEQSPRFF